MTTPLYSNRSAVPALLPAAAGVQVPPEGDFLGQSYDVVWGVIVVSPADSPSPPLAVGDVWTFAGSSYTVAQIFLYGFGTVPTATLGAQAGPDAVQFTSGDFASVATLLKSGVRTSSASPIPNPYLLQGPSPWPVITLVVSGGSMPGGSSSQIQYNNAGAFGGIVDGATGSIMVSQGTSSTPAFATTGLVITQYSSAIIAATPGATITFNLAQGNIQSVTLGANSTLVFSGAVVGQRFVLNLQQAASGGPYSPTWPGGITWLTPTYAAPAFPATASAVITVSFLCTGSGAYLGYYNGQSAS